jgi:tetratricopeptide (TPR) repeat protein
MLLTASVALFLSAALPQSQERIFLRNGQVLQVDKILTETYAEVTYRKGGSEGRKPANEVLSLEHSTVGRPLGEYADALELMTDGDFRRAMDRFEGALQDKDLADEARYSWVKQHALWNVMQCSAALGDLDSIIKTTDRLLTAAPDSFFYAPALLKKAEALQDKNDAKGAEATFKQLQSDVGAKGLHEEWARKAELGLVLLDRALPAAEKQRKLEGIAEKNKGSPEFADVASRARVEVGSTRMRKRASSPSSTAAPPTARSWPARTPASATARSTSPSRRKPTRARPTRCSRTLRCTSCAWRRPTPRPTGSRRARCASPVSR